MSKKDLLRYGFVFLTFLGVFSTYPKAVHQAQAEEPAGDIVYISTPQEFQDINLDLTAHYKIVNDIDFDGFILSPIAPSSAEPFTGIIDGMGFRLTNVMIPNSNNYLIRQNNGLIIDLNFIDIAYFSSGTLSTNKNFLSIIHFNYGTLENIKVSWKNTSYNFTSENLVCLSFFVYENYGLISQIIVSTTLINQPFKISGGSTELQMAILVINNYGEINQVFIANNLQINFMFDNGGFMYGGFVFHNKSLGIIRDVYMDQNFTAVFFIYDISKVENNLNRIINLSSFIHYNEGLIEYFYHFGSTNLIFSFYDSRDHKIELSRSVTGNNIASTLGNGIVRNGFSNTHLRLFTLTKTFVFNSLNQLSNNNLNPFFYFTNHLVINTISSVEFGHLSIENHTDYVFQAESGYLSTWYETPFVNDFDNYIFNSNHFTYTEESNAGLNPNATNSSTSELSKETLNNEAWTDDQLSPINAYVLEFVTKLPFELSNYSTYEIGTSYNVPPEIEVSLNGVLLQAGTYYLNDTGNYLFEVNDSKFSISNSVSLIVYSDSFDFPTGTYLGSFTPTLDENMSATLNGENYVRDTPINEPGDHILVITGENDYSLTYTFSIALEVTGVTDEAVYTGTRTITFSGGTATLNGQPFTSDTQVQDVGIYTLVINGRPGFTRTITFTIRPFSDNLSNDQIYQPDFTPNLVGEGMEITLNGNPYEIGTPINEPGDHILVITGENDYSLTYTFSIALEVTGVTNNAEYLNDSRTITFSGGQATLNGQSIESGFVLNRIGHFELEISGVNGYKLTYRFTNSPNVNGVSEGIHYTGSTNIEILGNGINLTMNGESFNNGNYSQPGQHTLHIFADGDYLKIINFRIVPIISGGNIISGQQFVNSTVDINISGGNPTLNGVPIDLVYTVNEVGYYLLVIPQTNLPNFELTFYILPDISLLQDNRTYIGSVKPTILGEGMNVTLNNQPYVSGTRITNPGQNTIRITSANGDYVNVINFTITLQFSGLTDGGTYYDVITPSFSGGMATLNGEPFVTNTEITTYGNFELVIVGDTNFIRTYKFTILPYDMVFPDDGASDDKIDLRIVRVHSLTKITLNGEEINRSRSIQLVGHYDLVITFDGNIISETRFTVEPQDYVADGSEFTSPISIHHPFAIVKINGKEVNHPYRIDIQGQYNVEVFGINDYYHNYSFTFINQNLELYQHLVTPMIATVIGSLAIFLIRKRMVA